MDLWKSLSEDAPSPRIEILLNLDDRYKQAAVIDGRYKLMQGIMKLKFEIDLLYHKLCSINFLKSRFDTGNIVLPTIQ